MGCGVETQACAEVVRVSCGFVAPAVLHRRLPRGTARHRRVHEYHFAWAQIFSKCRTREFAALDLAQCSQILIRIQRCHAAGSGTGDRLAVDLILHVTGRKYTGYTGRGGVAL